MIIIFGRMGNRLMIQKRKDHFKCLIYDVLVKLEQLAQGHLFLFPTNNKFTLSCRCIVVEVNNNKC